MEFKKAIKLDERCENCHNFYWQWFFNFEKAIARKHRITSYLTAVFRYSQSYIPKIFWKYSIGYNIPIILDIELGIRG
jgi:hypothetical protein